MKKKVVIRLLNQNPFLDINLNFMSFDINSKSFFKY